MKMRFGGSCWAFFGRFLVIFPVFLVLSTRKNRVIYNVFVPLASKKSFCQHAGNCVNSSVLARLGPQNTVNTVIFARRGSKPRKYRGFCVGAEPKTLVFTVFFCSAKVKNGENTARRFDAFWGLQKTSI